MKKIALSLITFIASISLLAQAPNAFQYQAVARDATGKLIVNQSVSFKISILQGSTNGTALYSEVHDATTNSYGLVNLEIGSGTSSDNFLTIDWSTGPYFVQVEMDASGGSNYALMGTSQLLSVPFALHAKTAETVTGEITETDPEFTTWDKSTGISITENQISDLGIYIETETDPEYTSWDKSTGISITEGQISDLGNYIETETDPTFTSSQAAKITATDITNLSNLSGTNTGNQSLSVNGQDLSISNGNTVKLNSIVPQYTQDEIDALSPIEGLLVYNSDYNMLQFYDGTHWNGSQTSGCLPQPNKPSSGSDVNSISLTVNISGNEPNKGINGYWNVASNNGGSFADSSSNETSFTGANDSLYYLTWSLYSKCDTITSSQKRVYISNTIKSIDFNGTLYVYPVDISTGIQWNNGSNVTTNALSTTNGAANTDSIIKYQGAGAYAAYLCDTLTAFGHSDWYLPAKDELNAMYQNKEAIGGLSLNYYWSSTETAGNFYAWYQYLGFDHNGQSSTNNKYRVRCVRRD